MRISLIPSAACALLCLGCRPPATSPPPQAPDTAAPKTPAAAATPTRLLAAGTNEVAVLMYHDVVDRKDVWFDVTTQEFEKQMAALKRAGAVVVPLADVVEHFRSGSPLPDRAVAITFDDNTLGIYENAFPILQRYGYHSTHFVHTNYVGVTTGKDHVSWDQLREMEATGLADVQSHTASHPADLRALTDAEIAEELATSRYAIETEMGHPARFLAYTEGNADERVAEAAAAAGFEAAFDEQRGWVASPADAFFLPRFAPFRLGDVVQRLSLPSADPHRGATRVHLQAAPASPFWPDAKFGTHKGWVMEGVWPESFPKEPRSTTLPCIRSLLSKGEFSPVGSRVQWTMYGRPLVVATESSAALLPYRPWMGESEEALQRAAPGAVHAVIGREWLLSGGMAPKGLPRERLRSPAFAGVTAQGAFVAGQVAGNISSTELAALLLARGIRDAALLDG